MTIIAGNLAQRIFLNSRLSWPHCAGNLEQKNEYQNFYYYYYYYY